MSTQNSIRVYGIGGAGIGITRSLAALNIPEGAASAALDVCFATTSDADVPLSLPRDRIFRVEGTNGGGQDRRLMDKPFRDAIPSLVHKFKPSTNMNIIVHGSSGASGATGGPHLASYLLDKDLPFVVVLVVGEENAKARKTTLNTLLSYEKISSKKDKPITVFPVTNRSFKDRSEADERARSLCMCLGVVCSGKNERLDPTDIKHWLRYDLVTDLPAGLTTLQVGKATPILSSSHEQVVSALQLVEAGATPPEIEVPYLTTGWLPASFDARQSQGVIPGALMLTLNGLDTLIKTLKERVEESDAAHGLVRASRHLKNDSDDGDDLVL